MANPILPGNAIVVGQRDAAVTHEEGNGHAETGIGPALALVLVAVAGKLIQELGKEEARDGVKRSLVRLAGGHGAGLFTLEEPSQITESDH